MKKLSFNLCKTVHVSQLVKFPPCFNKYDPTRAPVSLGYNQHVKVKGAFWELWVRINRAIHVRK